MNKCSSRYVHELGFVTKVLSLSAFMSNIPTTDRHINNNATCHNYKANVNKATWERASKSSKNQSSLSSVKQKGKKKKTTLLQLADACPEIVHLTSNSLVRIMQKNLISALCGRFNLYWSQIYTREVIQS